MSTHPNDPMRQPTSQWETEDPMARAGAPEDPPMEGRSRWQTPAGTALAEDAPAYDAPPQDHLAGPTLSQARWADIHDQVRRDLEVEWKAAEAQAEHLRQQEATVRYDRMSWERQASALRSLTERWQRSAGELEEELDTEGAKELARQEEELAKRAARGQQRLERRP